MLTVQGANGIYTSFELKEAAATEINQLLDELVSIANTKGATGRSIFGGYQTGTEDQPNPFVPIYQTLTAGNQGDAMIGVEYRGNIGKFKREVAKGEYMDVERPGKRGVLGDKPDPDLQQGRVSVYGAHQPVDTGSTGARSTYRRATISTSSSTR